MVTPVVWVRSTSWLSYLGTPAAAPAGGANASAAFMHLLNFGIVRYLGFCIQVECVLHLSCRMVLRLEKCIEVPEAGLNDRPLDLCEAHLQHDLSHEIDEPLVGVLFAGIDFIGSEGDVVGTRIAYLWRFLDSHTK